MEKFKVDIREVFEMVCDYLDSLEADKKFHDDECDRILEEYGDIDTVTAEIGEAEYAGAIDATKVIKRIIENRFGVDKKDIEGEWWMKDKVTPEPIEEEPKYTSTNTTYGEDITIEVTVK